MAKVTVVGAGVIGLSTAVELLDAGHEVVVLTRDDVSGTTSAVAGAIWWPFHVSPKERTDAWGQASLVHYEQLATSDLAAGVRMASGTYRTSSADADRWWADLPGARLIGEEPGFETYALRLPMIDMPVYLPWLAACVARRGGRIVERKLDSLDEVEGCDVIVNCAGLGARELVGDSDLHALRGQVVLVRRNGVEDFAIDMEHPEGLAHVFPRADTLVLGAVTELSESLEPDEATTQSLLRRGAALHPRLADAEVVAVAVGLRPARSAVRLELEESAVGRPRVVHNYGHGGGGVTLSWGCAEEVRAICGP